jgi:uncharacterized peroxidase-related enzyme
MSRLTLVNPEQTDGKRKELLETVKNKMGLIPNMTKAMAVSPAVLEGYLGFSGAVGKSLTAKLRAQIALTVAQQNTCEYCLSAHTAIGKAVGLSQSDIEASREARATDTRTEAALEFAKRVIETRGEVGSQAVTELKQAGFSDAEVADITAHVALNLFTNYFNKVVDTDIDFPKVEVTLAKAA